VFLLETKNLAGTISFDDGTLQARQFDDPDEIYRYTTLAARLRGQASELSARYTAETGKRTWVNAVVVIWGDYHQKPIEHNKITYLRGDDLLPWLTSKGAGHAAGFQ
jgi:hypothetical protein